MRGGRRENKFVIGELMTYFLADERLGKLARMKGSLRGRVEWGEVEE